MRVRILHRSSFPTFSLAREVQTAELLISNQAAAGSNPVARSKILAGIAKKVKATDCKFVNRRFDSDCLLFSHRRSQTAKALVLETRFCEFDSRRRYFPKKFWADDVIGSIEVLQTSRKSSNLFQSIKIYALA